MKSLHRISLLLVAIPLVATLWSSLPMLLFVQHERLEIAGSQVGFYYANFVHEAGFARLMIAIIGLLILFIPFRKAERWAFVAVALLMVCYELPVFFFLSMERFGSWPIFQGLANPKVVSFQTVDFYRYFFMILALAGLAIAMPTFIRRHKIAPVGGT